MFGKEVILGFFVFIIGAGVVSAVTHRSDKPSGSETASVSGPIPAPTSAAVAASVKKDNLDAEHRSATRDCRKHVRDRELYGLSYATSKAGVICKCQSKTMVQVFKKNRYSSHINVVIAAESGAILPMNAAELRDPDTKVASFTKLQSSLKLCVDQYKSSAAKRVQAIKDPALKAKITACKKDGSSRQCQALKNEGLY